ncbi:mis18-binding protein 1 isoform X2 [Ornithorhynchus anatinus]|uniref:mis18-binding protein 1 isoform X2 n=1 Tax=Ornithorhynchus anatinus TaxID=9258 RepID=UPI0010A7EA7B|nr:mis18-binding protein 1 isoform X2 [Ornithorhynchus anatinus]
MHHDKLSGAARMFSTPPKGLGFPGSSERENMPFPGVLMSHIPVETLTPLKDLAKFQRSGFSASKRFSAPLASDNCKENLPEETGSTEKKESIFHSTLIGAYTCPTEFPNISDIKPSSDSLTLYKNEMVAPNRFKREFDPVTYESPVKIFERMKAKALQDKQKQNSTNRRWLDPNSHKRDVILTPTKGSIHKVPPLDKRDRKGDQGTRKPFSDCNSLSGTAQNQTWVMPRQVVSHREEETLGLKSPNQFALGMKPKVLKQTEKRSSCGASNDDFARMNQNAHIPTSAVRGRTSTKFTFDQQTNDLSTTTFRPEGVLTLESIDADDERSQNTFLNTISTSCIPGRTRSHLTSTENTRKPKETFQEMATESDNPEREMDIQDSSPDKCEILLASPRIQIPRRQDSQIHGDKTPSSLSHTDAKKVSHKKQKVICLKEWLIKAIKNNRAVCLEGKLKNSTDLYWHSNAVEKRLEHNQLQTVSGNIYILNGPIDTISMKQEGYPCQFIRKFMFGFPENWKQYVEDFLQDLRNRQKKRKKGGRVQVQKQEAKDQGLGRGKSVEIEERTKVARQKIRSTTFDVDPEKSEKHSELSPVSHNPSKVSELRYSRVGRPLKSPLQFWRGEREICDHEMNVTLHEGGVDHLQSLETTGKMEKKKLSLARKKVKKEVKTNERMNKSHHRERTGALQQEGKEEIQPRQSQSQAEPSLSGVRENEWRSPCILLTPLHSKAVLSQKCMKYNLSRNTMRKISALTMASCNEESKGDKTDLSEAERTLEKSLENLCTNEDWADLIKNPPDSLKKKAKTTSPSRKEPGQKTGNLQRDLSKSSKLKRSKTPVVSRRKSSTRLLSTSSDSEVEQRSQKKAHPVAKPGQRDSNGSVASQRRSPRLAHRESLETAGDKKSTPVVQVKQEKAIFSSDWPVQKSLPRSKYSSGKAELKEVGKAWEPKSSDRFPPLNVEDDWTEEELQRFQSAFVSLPKHRNGFWLDVAMYVGTRSAEECQKKHMEDWQGNGLRPQATKKAVLDQQARNGDANKEPVRITARLGTLKRKQQMRDFLDQLPKDDHDDIFSASPLRARKVKLPVFSVKGDDEVLPLLSTDPATPSSASFPLATTPQCEHISPGMLGSINRNDCDKFVLRMQKDKKGSGGLTWGNVKKQKVGTDFTTPTSRRTGCRRTAVCTPRGADRSGVGKFFTCPTNSHSDEEEEEEDNYFSSSDSEE